MAAAKKLRKNKTSSFLCSFRGCFGFSNKVSADDEGKRNASEDAFVETAEKGHSRGESCPMIKKQKSEMSAPLLHEKSPAKEEVVVVVVGGECECEFDSMVGAVILMVTLVVMVICGKLCAILCTAAWFYFVPRFRPKLDKMKINSGQTHTLHSE